MTNFGPIRETPGDFETTAFPKSSNSGFPSSAAPPVETGFDPGPIGGTVTRPAAPPPPPAASPSRNLLYIGGAAALVAILIVVVIGFSGGGGDSDDSAGSSRVTNPITETAESESGSGQWGSSGDGSTASGPRQSSNDLNVSVPMSHPPCDGSGIVVLANAVTPGRYDSEIQRYLNMYPGSSYLRTDESCSSLRRRDDAGNPIYAVYRPAGRTQSQVCSAVRAAGGTAYGKWLDNTTDPRHMIQC
ncbi:serine/threonine protein kinase [Mycolicibacterium rutilum]|uniref:Serine/threonine protein kinase n=1 Tax=Mycolicibacterium rutilum TaxID=370526 RepID=A0A1H6IGU9_MYCRU|nr:hypothetical protein [Mycolicibacterium rutilum]SEH48025.1 serine/threonine protein kinase [Mycolicibacterium rutilum]